MEAGMTMGKRFWKLAGGSAFAALMAASLVQAQPAPQAPPPGVVPPQEAAPPSEEPPPAPGETTAPGIVPPVNIAPSVPIAPPPVKKEDDQARAEDQPAREVAAPVETGPPGVRKRHGAVVIQALDKITAETMRFEVKVGKPVRWKGLVFTAKACETTAPDEPMQDVAAYLDVRAEPRTQTEEKPSRQVFKGWMFASAPGVSAMEHPVYDAWVIACRA